MIQFPSILGTDETIINDSMLPTSSVNGMIGVLMKFLHTQRQRHWLDNLSEADNMVPYIIAAGDHKYGLFLPVCLTKIDILPFLLQ